MMNNENQEEEKGNPEESEPIDVENDEYQDCQEQQEYYDPQYEQEYQPAETLERADSTSKPYITCDRKKLVRKIEEEIKDKQMTTGLTYEETFMLYSLCQFSEHQLVETLDAEGTGKNMIYYTPQYELKITNGECEVCCEEGKLLMNSCGHSFCENCWKFHLEAQLKDNQLIPKCQCGTCVHWMHLILIHEIIKEDAHLTDLFLNLLCKKYTRKSDKVKMCPKESCDKALYINYCDDKILNCDCGTILCKYCGKQNHFPLDCADFDNWIQMVNDKQNQWIHTIVTKKCPMCKQPIEKNQGCNHMTCRCKYEFCWVCEKIWKGHTDQGCNNISQHEKKMKIQQEKRKTDQNYYNQRFELAKAQAERFENLTKRVSKISMKQFQERLGSELHILNNDTFILNQLQRLLFSIFNFGRCSAIYQFFERENCKVLSFQASQTYKACDEIDDLISKKIEDILASLTKKKGAITQEEGRKQYFQERQKMIFNKTKVTKLFQNLQMEYGFIKK